MMQRFGVPEPEEDDPNRPHPNFLMATPDNPDVRFQALQDRYSPSIVDRGRAAVERAAWGFGDAIRDGEFRIPEPPTGPAMGPSATSGLSRGRGTQEPFLGDTAGDVPGYVPPPKPSDRRLTQQARSIAEDPEDEASLEAARQQILQYRADATPGEYVRHGLQGSAGALAEVAAGGLGGFGALRTQTVRQGVDGLRRVAEGLNAQLPEWIEQMGEREAHEHWASLMADRIRDVAERIPGASENPAVRENFIFGQVMPAMGSFAGYALLGAALGPAGPKIAAAGTATAAGLGGADRIYREAREFGVEEDDALRSATIGGVPGGVVQVFGPISFLRRMGRIRQGEHGGIVRTAGRAGGLGALEEGGAEGAGQVIFNAAAMSYDRDRQLFDNWLESALVGTVAGGAFGAGGGAVAAIRSEIQQLRDHLESGFDVDLRPLTPDAQEMIADMIERSETVLQQIEQAEQGVIQPERGELGTREPGVSWQDGPFDISAPELTMRDPGPGPLGRIPLEGVPEPDVDLSPREQMLRIAEPEPGVEEADPFATWGDPAADITEQSFNLGEESFGEGPRLADDGSGFVELGLTFDPETGETAPLVPEPVAEAEASPAFSREATYDPETMRTTFSPRHDEVRRQVRGQQVPTSGPVRLMVEHITGHDRVPLIESHGFYSSRIPEYLRYDGGDVPAPPGAVFFGHPQGQDWSSADRFKAPQDLTGSVIAEIDLRNPYHVRSTEEMSELMEQVRAYEPQDFGPGGEQWLPGEPQLWEQWAADTGHDGVVVHPGAGEGSDNSFGYDQIVVFDPSQVSIVSTDAVPEGGVLGVDGEGSWSSLGDAGLDQDGFPLPLPDESTWLDDSFDGVMPEPVVSDAEVVAPDAAVATEGVTEAPADPNVVPLRQAESPAVQRGERQELVLPDGERVPVQYALVDYSQTQTSHNPIGFEVNPEFPAEIQDRRYHSDRAAQEEVQSQSARLDPDLLLDPTSVATTGPSVLREDGVVLSGNQRNMILVRAREMHPERYEAYVNALRERAADFGLDPAGIDAIIERGGIPGVGRVMEQSVTDRGELQRLMAEFNQGFMKDRDSLAEAQVAARRLARVPDAYTRFQKKLDPERTVRHHLQGATGRDFLVDLVRDNVIDRRKMSALVGSDGLPNAEGRTFLERMLTSMVVPNADVIDTAPAGWMNKIQRAIPAVMETQHIEGWDMTPVIQEAMELGAELRANENATKVVQITGQRTMFEGGYSPMAEALARMLESENPTTVANALRAYATRAAEVNKASQADDIFGWSPPNQAEVFAQHLDPHGVMEVATEAEAEAPTREPGAPAEGVAVQDDMFGAPTQVVEGDEQAGMFGERDFAPDDMRQMESRAQQDIERLGPLVEEGVATAEQADRYREATALLRRGEAMGADEVRPAEGMTEMDPLAGDLFESEAEAPAPLTLPDRARRNIDNLAGGIAAYERARQDYRNLGAYGEERMAMELERNQQAGLEQSQQALRDALGSMAPEARAVAEQYLSENYPGDLLEGVIRGDSPPTVFQSAPVWGEGGHSRAVADAQAFVESLADADPADITPGEQAALRDAQDVVRLDQQARREYDAQERGQWKRELRERWGSFQNIRDFQVDLFAGVEFESLIEVAVPGVLSSREIIDRVKAGEEIANVWVQARGHRLHEQNAEFGVATNEQGEQVLDRRKVFDLMRAFRHPKAEFSHVIAYVVEDGRARVIDHAITTVGSPVETSMTDQMIEDFFRKAKEAGGSILTAHNHPLGDPTPSQADKVYAARMSALAKFNNVEYAGELVMNHDVAAWISAQMLDNLKAEVDVQTVAAEIDLSDQANWTQRGPQLSDMEAARDVFANLPRDAERVDILFVDENMRSMGLHSKPLSEVSAYLADGLSSDVEAMGANSVVVGVHGKSAREVIAADLTSQRKDYGSFTSVWVDRFDNPLVTGTVDTSSERGDFNRFDMNNRKARLWRINLNAEDLASFDGETISPRAGATTLYTQRAPTDLTPEDSPRPQSPPRPGPPPVENHGQAQGRLQHNRNVIDVIREHMDRQGKRVPLDTAVEAGEQSPDIATQAVFSENDARRLDSILEDAMLPRRVRQAVRKARKATTALKAKRALEQADRAMTDEQKRHAIAEIQETYRRARNQKITRKQKERLDQITQDIDFKQLSPNQIEHLRDVARVLQNDPEAVIPTEVLSQMAVLNQQSLRDMEPSELNAVNMALKHWIDSVREHKRMLGTEKNELRSEIVESARAEAVSRMDPLKQQISRFGEKIRGSRRFGSEFFNEFSVRPEVLLENLGETLRRYVWENVTVQGQLEYLRRKHEFEDAFAGLVQDQLGIDMSSDSGRRNLESWRRQVFNVEADGVELQLNRDEVMHFILLMSDPSNEAMATRNGMVVTRHGQEIEITEAMAREINALAGPTERAFADFMFEQFNTTMKDYLNDAWEQVYGEAIATVPSYVPRTVDMTYADTSADPLKAMALAQEATLTSWGHLRERSKAHRAKLELGSAMELYSNHLQHVSRISSYLAPYRNARILLGHPEIKRTLIERVGEGGFERLENSLEQQVTLQPSRHRAEDWVRRRIRMFSASTLALRATTLALNPTGLPISASYQKNGFANLAKAMATMSPSEWQRVSEKARETAPYWRDRYESFVSQTTAGILDPRSNYTFGPRDVSELGLVPLQKSDQFGAIVRWKMAELHVQNELGVQEGSDRYDKLVADEWTRLMFRGENTSHGGDMTGAIAWGRENTLASSFVVFTSSVSKIYSAAARGVYQANRGDFEGAAQSLAAATLSIAFASGVRELARSLRGNDDEDEGPVERAMIRGMTEAAGLVPILGPSVLSPTVRSMMGADAFSFSASVTEDVLQNSARTFASAVRSMHAITSQELDAMGEDERNRHLQNAATGIMEIAANWRGLPYSGPADAKRMFDNIVHSQTPEEVATELLRQEREERGSTVQGRRRVIRAVNRNSGEELRRALTEWQEETGQRPTTGEVMGHLRSNNSNILAFDPRRGGESLQRYRALDENQRANMDTVLEEYRERERILRQLLSENRDLVRSTGDSRGRTRRQRPQRTRR